MPQPPPFTDADDKALLILLAGIPAQKLAAIIAFLLIYSRPDRARLVNRLRGLN